MFPPRIACSVSELPFRSGGKKLYFVLRTYRLCVGQPVSMHTVRVVSGRISTLRGEPDSYYVSTGIFRAAVGLMDVVRAHTNWGWWASGAAPFVE